MELYSFDKNPFKSAGEKVDMSRPAADFKYPPFPEVPPEADISKFLDFQVRIFHQVPKGQSKRNVSFFKNYNTLLKNYILSLAKSSKVNVLSENFFHSAFSEMSESEKIKHFALSRDLIHSAELENYLPQEKIDFVFLSHPNSVDGFYVPEDILIRSYQILRARYPNAEILVEESLLPFCFHIETPGTLRGFLDSDPKLSLSVCLYPAFCPQGPQVSWLYSKNKILSEAVENEELKNTVRALMAFNQKGGRALSEFHRRLLVLRTSLRILADGLKPLLMNHSINVPFWPDAGFFLILNVNPGLKKLGISMKEFLNNMESQSGLVFEDLTAYGQPGHLKFCFGSSPSRIEAYCKEFVKAFPKGD